MLNFLLNRGGAGVSFSRADTIERLVPLMQRHNELMVAYDQLLGELRDRDLAARLDGAQPRLRMDAAKVSESILSAGGTPPLGTDLEPDGLDLGADDRERLGRVLDLEEAYFEQVQEEIKSNHAIRTRAILGNLDTASRARLDLLRGATGRTAR